MSDFQEGNYESEWAASEPEDYGPQTTDSYEYEEGEYPELNIPVKYNSEERVITDLEEAQQYIQKGMNYDKIYDRLEELEAQAQQYDYLNQLAEERGLDMEEMAALLENSRYNERISQLVNEEGYDEETAEKLAEYEELKEAFEEIQEQQFYENIAQNELDDFFQQYPNADVDSCSPEFWEEAAQIGIEMAYLRHLNRERLTNYANANNEMATPGDVTGGGNRFEITSMEQIKDMSPAQRHRYMQEIRKFITGKEQ